MKLLVPTDFSDNAMNAINYAGLIAEVTDSSVEIVHVVVPPHKGIDTPEFLFKEEVDELTLIAKTQLEKIIQDLKLKYPRVTFSYETVSGIAANEIIQLSSKNNSDLIVMGTSGASGIKKIFLGSNASLIIDKAEIPVLTIPKNAGSALPQRMVFATDFNDSDAQNIAQLANLAKLFNAEIMIAHIVEKDQNPETERSLISFFSEKVQELTDYSKISYHIFSDKNVLKGISLFTESMRADLLAISQRKRGAVQKFFSKSITQELSFTTKIPLFAFHVKEDSEVV